jgi:hypothetical protein
LRLFGESEVKDIFGKAEIGDYTMKTLVLSVHNCEGMRRGG